MSTPVYSSPEAAANLLSSNTAEWRVHIFCDFPEKYVDKTKNPWLKLTLKSNMDEVEFLTMPTFPVWHEFKTVKNIQSLLIIENSEGKRLKERQLELREKKEQTFLELYENVAFTIEVRSAAFHEEVERKRKEEKEQRWRLESQLERKHERKHELTIPMILSSDHSESAALDIKEKKLPTGDKDEADESSEMHLKHKCVNDEDFVRQYGKIHPSVQGKEKVIEWRKSYWIGKNITMWVKLYEKCPFTVMAIVNKRQTQSKCFRGKKMIEKNKMIEKDTALTPRKHQSSSSGRFQSGPNIVSPGVTAADEFDYVQPSSELTIHE